MMPTSASLYPSEMESTGVPSSALHLALSEQLSLLDVGSLAAHPDSVGGIPFDFFQSPYISDENRPLKRSQNMTECVPVPSSEHVAEIVGRQGCKIKALRAKTNTYIKTPIRDEEPVFVVTGRKEDVAMAKKEILSAAEHFSQIRAQRKSGVSAPRPPNIPGQVTITVPVAFRVVGLVVGPKGATIKRIQNQTNTYILTPSRESSPVFTVTGLPDNVEQARREIISHIESRTNAPYDENVEADCYRRPLLSSSSVVRELTQQVIVQSKPNNPFYGSNNPFNDQALFQPQIRRPDPTMFIQSHKSSMNNLMPIGTGGPRDFQGESTLGWGNGGSISYDDSTVWMRQTPCDTGISPLAPPENLGFPGSITSGLRSLIGSSSTPTPGSSSVTGSSLSSGKDSPPFGSSGFGGTRDCSPRSSPPSTASPGASSSEELFMVATGRKRSICNICFEAPIVAALVPCGHNLFCLECAQSICDRDLSVCPVCQQPVTQAIRIITT
ncbi:unnamed protein product [Cyprideis torosa]|uniref:Uncharacterized protein n=1 Tax=Cyprideis torosa TaxID=163714 RepID=A0A7R8WB98_9CRUS|nr:unnamed protein product [Cyprideis torosa]CAG0889329.1 unnamed protein product [Cyprideis torosa]